MLREDPTIWYAGGGIGQTRFYSRFLALQIQADLAGKTLPIYLDNSQVISLRVSIMERSLLVGCH